MAYMITQPATLNSDSGAIVSIGMVSGNNRAEIVLPLATDGDVDINVGLAQLVSGIELNLLPALLDCVSSDTEILFVQAEGMALGTMTPNREDFEVGSYIGTRASDPMPTSVAALIIFYGDPTDLGPNDGPRVGKNFIPGISEDDLTSGRIDASLYANLITLGELLGNGFDDAVGTPNKWYRVVSAVREPGEALPIAFSGVVRQYTGTQRRRQLPH